MLRNYHHYVIILLFYVSAPLSGLSPKGGVRSRFQVPMMGSHRDTVTSQLPVIRFLDKPQLTTHRRVI